MENISNIATTITTININTSCGPRTYTVVEDDDFRVVRTADLDPALLERLQKHHVIHSDAAREAEGYWALPPMWRAKCRDRRQQLIERELTWPQLDELRQEARARMRAATRALPVALDHADSVAAEVAEAEAASAAESAQAAKALVRLERLRRRADARADREAGDRLTMEIRVLRLAENARHRARVEGRLRVQQAEVGAHVAYYDVILAAINSAAAEHEIPTT